MGKPKIYIDGKEGTTGLQIYDRLAEREDIDLLLIDEDKRKDRLERKKLLNAADLVFLCLPDAAAKEAAALIENQHTRVIDASTAHRTSPDWVYGFPELHGRREQIKSARRVANPGCHATGFISIAAPLVELGLLPADGLLTCFSLTGYSGGGKKMIAQYEGEDRPCALSSPALYGVLQNHKHLPEMQKVCALAYPPVFTPIVDDYYKGMAATVPLRMSQLRGVSTLHEVWQALSGYYGGEGVVQVEGDPTDPDSGMDSGFKIYANMLRGKDTLSLIVAGNDQQFTVTALFDNLGKGASGAAVQNMNLMLGFGETAGLNL
ncbi:N-acetyl-gamma-glutamyl-phosphate reductase [Pseudoflavonifractor sp. 524-17]|uniref:N-acetyl-gamma-glutamyl-phosphate reductase n=1 Tax=Pseudoflavonifractor sp. 524-17 TaxID=2304577 RepID=UPI00137A096B|nr:N-acetyl-gamma-glutamyl-phosphate reductase [Pseudoflavonifractor sp. 524-17]NCE64040.1 N-acetyl-gamma-glutamyl-phosphate reductase [Pseudoflavonifractor sp. 524-17]